MAWTNPLNSKFAPSLCCLHCDCFVNYAIFHFLIIFLCSDLESDRCEAVDGGADCGEGAREYPSHSQARQPGHRGHPVHNVERQQLVTLADNSWDSDVMRMTSIDF